MSWIKVSGTIFIALVIAAAIFYFVGGAVQQFGSITGMTILENTGQGGINIGLALIVILVILIVVYILFQQGGQP